MSNPARTSRNRWFLVILGVCISVSLFVAEGKAYAASRPRGAGRRDDRLGAESKAPAGGSVSEKTKEMVRLGMFLRDLEKEGVEGLVLMNGMEEIRIEALSTRKTSASKMADRISELLKCGLQETDHYYFLYPQGFEALTQIQLPSLDPVYDEVNAEIVFGANLPLYMAFAWISQATGKTIVADDLAAAAVTGELSVGEVPLRTGLEAILKSARAIGVGVDSTPDYVFFYHPGRNPYVNKRSLLINSEGLSAEQSELLARRVNVVLPTAPGTRGPIPFQAGALPFSKAVQSLSRQLGVPIGIDKALEDLPVNPVVFTDVPIGTVLDLVIRQWLYPDIGYEVQKNQIIVRRLLSSGEKQVADADMKKVVVGGQEVSGQDLGKDTDETPISPDAAKSVAPSTAKPEEVTTSPAPVVAPVEGVVEESPAPAAAPEQPQDAQAAEVQALAQKLAEQRAAAEAAAQQAAQLKAEAEAALQRLAEERKAAEEAIRQAQEIKAAEEQAAADKAAAEAATQKAAEEQAAADKAAAEAAAQKAAEEQAAADKAAAEAAAQKAAEEQAAADKAAAEAAAQKAAEEKAAADKAAAEAAAQKAAEEKAAADKAAAEAAAQKAAEEKAAADKAAAEAAAQKAAEEQAAADKAAAEAAAQKAAEEKAAADKAAAEAAAQQPPTLKERLEALKAKFQETAAPEIAQAYQQGIDELAQSGIVDKAKKVGEQAPMFELPNVAGQPVKLEDLLKQGPVVLVWYRGAWCPYCNVQLQALQEALPRITEQGARVLALSPQKPEHSAKAVQESKLGFELLADAGNKTAKQYGIAYKLPDVVAQHLTQQVDFNAYNGDASNELPLSATYIIDGGGVIRYAFLNADFRLRAEPADIVAALKTLKETPPPAPAPAPEPAPAPPAPAPAPEPAPVPPAPAPAPEPAPAPPAPAPAPEPAPAPPTPAPAPEPAPAPPAPAPEVAPAPPPA